MPKERLGPTVESG